MLQSTLNPTLWMTLLPQNVPLITSIQKNLLLFKELFLSPVYIMYLLFLLIPGWLKKFLMHQNVWTGIIPWIVVKWVGESKKCFLMFSEVNCFCEYINMKVPTEAFILPGFLKLQQSWKYLSFFYCLMSPVDRGSKAHCKPQSKALSRTKPLSHCHYDHTEGRSSSSTFIPTLNQLCNHNDSYLNNLHQCSPQSWESFCTPNSAFEIPIQYAIYSSHSS